MPSLKKTSKKQEVRLRGKAKEKVSKIAFNEMGPLSYNIQNTIMWYKVTLDEEKVSMVLI